MCCNSRNPEKWSPQASSVIPFNSIIIPNSSHKIIRKVAWMETISSLSKGTSRTWTDLVTTCLESSYLGVVAIFMEVVRVGSVWAPVTRLLEHFLGFGGHPWLALSHTTLWRSGIQTHTQINWIASIFSFQDPHWNILLHVCFMINA